MPPRPWGAQPPLIHTPLTAPDWGLSVSWSKAP